ncbi:MAG: tetraacyldisaccharide 4'-kinase [Alphaproteobacteria bacterium]|nr:tetraacyldisaccharide 4'-kinase [Alphaproteobacteria bacterium]
MKTPRFWYPQPGDRFAAIKATLLSPLSSLFKAGTALRKRFAHAYRSHKPLVCVGNVVAGGAGKTPTAIALAKILQDCGHRPVFITRGYGGKGELTCVDLAVHGAADVGDEALLLAATAPTWVCRDRVLAVREAEKNGTIIISDDGFQNPNLAPSASILVIDGQTGIGNGRIIPAGPLREPLEDALERAAAVIIVGTKDVQGIAKKVDIPVFRGHLEPSLPKGFPNFGKFFAFAGIARPSKFFATARALKLVVAGTREFADHHVYTEDDIDALRLEAEVRGARLLTTEKDAIRLPPAFLDEVIVLPVKLAFDTPGAEADIANLMLGR